MKFIGKRLRAVASLAMTFMMLCGLGSPAFATLNDESINWSMQAGGSANTEDLEKVPDSLIAIPRDKFSSLPDDTTSSKIEAVFLDEHNDPIQDTITIKLYKVANVTSSGYTYDDCSFPEKSTDIDLAVASMTYSSMLDLSEDLEIEAKTGGIIPLQTSSITSSGATQNNAVFENLGYGMYLMVPSSDNPGSQYQPQPCLVTVPMYDPNSDSFSTHIVTRLKYSVPSGDLRFTKIIGLSSGSLDVTITLANNNPPANGIYYPQSATGENDYIIVKASLVNNSLIEEPAMFNIFINKCTSTGLSYDALKQDHIVDLYSNPECTEKLNSTNVVLGPKESRELYVKYNLQAGDIPSNSSKVLNFTGVLASVEEDEDGNPMGFSQNTGKIVSVAAYANSSRMMRSNAMRVANEYRDINIQGEDEFKFTVKLIHADGIPVTGSFDCEGDKQGTVEFNDGEAVIYLGGNESVIFKNVPASCHYEIVEDKDSAVGYIPGNGGQVSGEISSEWITDTFIVNKPIPAGTMKIHKSVETFIGPEDEEFEFEFKLDFKDITTKKESFKYFKVKDTYYDTTTNSTKYDYYIPGEEGYIYPGQKFKLRDGEYLLILGIPFGTEYTITEYSEVYEPSVYLNNETSKSEFTGIVSEDKVDSITQVIALNFVNSPKGGPALPKTGGMGLYVYYLYIFVIFSSSFYIVRLRTKRHGG